MNYQKRPFLSEEEKYSYYQSVQISSQTGLIGFLRADFDTNGNNFFTTWTDHLKSLKSDDFKNEFDMIINYFRFNKEFLQSRICMQTFCNSNQEYRFNSDPDYFGVAVDTEEYTYLMRITPQKGMYNLYCYCYKKDWLQNHIQHANKGIRFITSSYREIFRIPDDSNIVIEKENQETVTKHCRYIDDYHVEVGSQLYHICEFAEMIERNKYKIRKENEIEN